MEGDVAMVSVSQGLFRPSPGTYEPGVIQGEFVRTCKAFARVWYLFEPYLGLFRPVPRDAPQSV